MSEIPPRVAVQPNAIPMPQGSVWKAAGRLLVVDDAEAVRTVVSRSVSKFGFAADLAADGEQGIALFTANPACYSLVLSDLRLPGKNGIDVIRECRRLRPNVPVVLMSGHNMQEVAALAEGLGPIVLLSKPFTLASLASALRAALGA